MENASKADHQTSLDALLVKNKQYYQQYLDYLPNRHSPIPDVIGSEMFLFPEGVIQMGHGICPPERKMINYRTPV
jgi:hypothetical protein